MLQIYRARMGHLLLANTRELASSSFLVLTTDMTDVDNRSTGVSERTLEIIGKSGVYRYGHALTERAPSKSLTKCSVYSSRAKVLRQRADLGYFLRDFVLKYRAHFCKSNRTAVES
jgi:hypothetical protein